MRLRLTVLSGPDEGVVAPACARLAAQGAAVLAYRHDGHSWSRWLDSGGGCRVARLGEGDRTSAVLRDLPAAVAEAREAVAGPDLVLRLPFAVDLPQVLDEAGELAEVDAVVVALDPERLEDWLWDPAPVDGLPVGEHLVDALSCADTCVLPAAGSGRGRGEHLLAQLAPRARAVRAGGKPGRPEFRLGAGGYDVGEVIARLAPGAVTVPVLDESGPFRTAVVRARRPLHPERLARAMPAMAAGSVWSRGRLWIASVPGNRVVWRGVGPHVSFEDGGGWDDDGLLDPASPDGDRRGTVLAFTGDEVDKEELRAALLDCELTAAECAGGPLEWADYPDPLRLARALPMPAAPVGSIFSEMTEENR
ncbi:GTP-binding protein [Amycolatopsis orientalis]|uniref:GTP-binding protein n=1 Tax=Amycolatopsis orientalis TaxID=31958 RepID=UPI00039D6FCF|nr:GTP-binding protein [Amycolatopsis orientalis]